MKAIISFLAIAMALSGAHLAAQKAAAEQEVDAATLQGREVSMKGEIVRLREHLFGKSDPKDTGDPAESVVRADTSSLGPAHETLALVADDKIHVLLFEKSKIQGMNADITRWLKKDEANVQVEGRHIEKKGVSAILVSSIEEDAR